MGNTLQERTRENKEAMDVALRRIIEMMNRHETDIEIGIYEDNDNDENEEN